MVLVLFTITIIVGTILGILYTDILSRYDGPWPDWVKCPIAMY